MNLNLKPGFWVYFIPMWAVAVLVFVVVNEATAADWAMYIFGMLVGAVAARYSDLVADRYASTEEPAEEVAA